MAAPNKPILRPGQALAEAFRRTRDFGGRSRRSAYWWFALFTTLGGVAFEMLDVYVPVPGLEDWSVLFILFCAVVVIPDLSLGVRRLHDTGRKGWLYVVWVVLTYGSIFLPEPSFENYNLEPDVSTVDFLIASGFHYTLIMGAISLVLMLIMIFLLTRDSQPGPNAYGPNPKGIGNPDVFS